MKRGFSSVVHRAWPTWATIALFVFLTWLGSLFFPPFIFPSVADTFWAVVTIFTQHYEPLLTTLARFFAALIAAAFAGWVVGLFMGAFRRYFGRFMRQVTSFVQAIPAISWVVLAVLWIQSIELRIFATTFLIAWPFFVIAVYEGIRDMDKDLLDAVDQFRPTRMQVLRILLVPQSLMTLMLAMRSTAAMTLKILVFFELIGANNGVGQQFSIAQTTYQIDLIFGWTIVLVIINFVMLWLFDLLERYLFRWRTEAVVR